MRRKGGERRIRLKTVNPHITCRLCKGYLIDATTITECLHTFCKCCIVKYLEENNTCPTCQIVIHQSHPLNYISHDRTMQDIVYKLVPNLHKNEQDREEKFYSKRGLPLPRSLSGIENGDENGYGSENKPPPQPKDDGDFHRTDEQVNVCLENAKSMKELKRKYLRLSALATITHLKKYVAVKVFSNIQRYKEVEILCNEEILGKDHSLKFVCVTRWKCKNTPLHLIYRPRVDIV